MAGEHKSAKRGMVSAKEPTETASGEIRAGEGGGLGLMFCLSEILPFFERY